MKLVKEKALRKQISQASKDSKIRQPYKNFYLEKFLLAVRNNLSSDIKQLLDEVEHDIMNYQNRGL